MNKIVYTLNSILGTYLAVNRRLSFKCDRHLKLFYAGLKWYIKNEERKPVENPENEFGGEEKGGRPAGVEESSAHF